jgi:hypothetical protein
MRVREFQELGVRFETWPGNNAGCLETQLAAKGALRAALRGKVRSSRPPDGGAARWVEKLEMRSSPVGTWAGDLRL